jgi:hypothetical protein
MPSPLCNAPSHALSYILPSHSISSTEKNRSWRRPLCTKLRLCPRAGRKGLAKRRVADVWLAPHKPRDRRMRTVMKMTAVLLGWWRTRVTTNKTNGTTRMRHHGASNQRCQARKLLQQRFLLKKLWNLTTRLRF